MELDAEQLGQPFRGDERRPAGAELDPGARGQQVFIPPEGRGAGGRRLARGLDVRPVVREIGRAVAARARVERLGLGNGLADTATKCVPHHRAPVL